MNYEELISVCKKKRLKIGTAESCTGGYIASSITDVAGASHCFVG
jgi:nicotinamide mononucleotide (NMN) deamidase PncC